MKERGNKTIMCSVLFLDIVGYSKMPVSGQIALRNSFNTLLADAIREVPAGDRIILDTGDGAAVSFLGDVEDALNTALRLRESLLGEGEHLPVRMGINLGPVRLVMDINGQPNIVGDGINVAQRVMGFADPGQILVSRSYYDAVSRLSHDYADMFHYQGSHTDKHVREHEIFAIGDPGDLAKAREGTATSRTARRVLIQRRRMLYAGLFAATLLLLISVAARITQSPVIPEGPSPTEAPVEASSRETVQLTSAVITALHEKTETAEEEAVEKRMAEKKAVEKKRLQTTLPAPDVREHAPAVAATVGGGIPIARVRTLEETTAIDPEHPALISISVTPWGEVYLDGKIQGVSPPLAELQVTPGKHDIEIRNGSFPAYTHDIRVRAGEKIKIKHKF
jgi:class 3 adenylate cyclase